MNRTMTVSEALLTIGVPAHLKGFDYMLCAVEAVQKEHLLIHRITTDLYPLVAERFGDTPSKVERGIRHGITNIIVRDRLQRVNELFGCNVFTEKDRPTNGELIALLARYCRPDAED